MSDPQAVPETLRRILVVANQTACGDELLAAIQAKVGEGPCHFTLLVPATPPGDHATRTEGDARAIATRRMTAAQARFADAGIEPVEGIVGDGNPIRAIDDVLIDQSHDEIILSTLPPGASRWLKLDLPSRVENRFALPVTTVVSERLPTS